MIAEITVPPSEAYRPTTQLWQRITSYSLGLIIGTMAVGGSMGMIGSLSQRATLPDVVDGRLWVAILAVITLTFSLREVNIVRLPMPQVRWQVPANWAAYGKLIQLFLYGIVLGVDVFTLIPYATFYALMIFEAILGIRGGVAIGFIYGVARALPTALGSIAAHRRRDSAPIAVRIFGSRGVLHGANSVALAVVGEVLLGALLTLW